MPDILCYMRVEFTTAKLSGDFRTALEWKWVFEKPRNSPRSYLKGLAIENRRKVTPFAVMFMTLICIMFNCRYDLVSDADSVTIHLFVLRLSMLYGFKKHDSKICYLCRRVAKLDLSLSVVVICTPVWPLWKLYPMEQNGCHIWNNWHEVRWKQTLTCHKHFGVRPVL